MPIIAMIGTSAKAKITATLPLSDVWKALVMNMHRMEGTVRPDRSCATLNKHRHLNRGFMSYLQNPLHCINEGIFFEIL